MELLVNRLWIIHRARLAMCGRGLSGCYLLLAGALLVLMVMVVLLNLIKGQLTSLRLRLHVCMGLGLGVSVGMSGRGRGCLGLGRTANGLLINWRRSARKVLLNHLH
jgi:uncharacterized protein YebE (UPF0316 family)